MEREALAADFGQRLVFHGGMDNQYTLPFGSPADVRQQVCENLRIFKNCKGYIVSPCHNIQVNTPTANIVALYEAVHLHAVAT
jgi:uroporphyrinogen decarboxylase